MNGWKQIIDAMPDGSMVLDGDGKVLLANTHAVEILGANPTGLPLTGFIRTHTLAEALQRAQTERLRQSLSHELHGRPPRSFNIDIAPLADGRENFVLLRDLTREQAVEQMRSDFVANASHEMRTPLATIIGSIETLQGAARDDSKARETFLATMLVQAHRMKRLIDDLLTLSRIELNEHVRPQGKVLLMNVARQAKANLAWQTADNNVSVEVEGEDEVAVTGDAEELLQVALNLIENAIKYGGDGGRVVVRVEHLGTQARLSVTDFGKGIADIHLPRLTERFYRVSTKESRRRGGTGLGLAIVKHIVLRHRGKLDIRSEVGRGSSFAVTIPLYKSNNYTVT